MAVSWFKPISNPKWSCPWTILFAIKAFFDERNHLRPTTTRVLWSACLRCGQNVRWRYWLVLRWENLLLKKLILRQAMFQDMCCHQKLTLCHYKWYFYSHQINVFRSEDSESRQRIGRADVDVKGRLRRQPSLRRQVRQLDDLHLWPGLDINQRFRSEPSSVKLSLWDLNDYATSFWSSWFFEMKCSFGWTHSSHDKHKSTKLGRFAKNDSDGKRQ